MTIHQYHGVETGCQVTAQGTPNTTVAVAAGGIINQNVPASVAAVASLDILTGHPADPTNDRIDSITVSNTGVVSLNVGTPATNPVAPASSDVEIAQVHIYSQANPSYTGTIVAGVIQDTRNYVPRHVSPYKVSGTWFGPLGSNASWAASTAIASGDLYLSPFWIGKTLQIKTIGCRNTAAGSAGTTGRLGIYSDDGSGGLSLLVDVGTVDLTLTGELTLATSQTLSPGWWWLALAYQNVGATKPVLKVCTPGGFSPVGASSITVISSQVFANGQSYGGIYYSGITGALPATPSGPDYSKLQFPGVWVQAT